MNIGAIRFYVGKSFDQYIVGQDGVVKIELFRDGAKVYMEEKAHIIYQGVPFQAKETHALPAPETDIK